MHIAGYDLRTFDLVPGGYRYWVWLNGGASVRMRIADGSYRIAGKFGEELNLVVWRAA